MAVVTEDGRMVNFVSFLNRTVPKKRRPAVAEFLNRANYRTRVGSFGINFSSGEVRFKTHVAAFEDPENINLDVLRASLYFNIAMMGKYMSGIMSVMNDGVEPAKAILEFDDHDAVRTKKG